ncbi:hypothetical protein Celaphus_00013873 [Cervus elaphus hippelaphus]|uniref:Uncharacterized protein n=1 Tax=Cervus elaphus hippelaphus TaxID=46360 RepID=A0A212CD28_CEREH|nr:hypothetical protein Celaphus_00013873 [Cervus elaphus hippelaphus]
MAETRCSESMAPQESGHSRYPSPPPSSKPSSVLKCLLGGGSQAKAAAASYLAEPSHSPSPGELSFTKASTVLILPNPNYFLNYFPPNNLKSATTSINQANGSRQGHSV